MAIEQTLRYSRLGLAMLSLLTVVFTGCRTTDQPLHVSHDEAFTSFFRRTNGWVAGDGAITVPMSDGRVLWLFGDSHIDTYNPETQKVPCLFQARNAGLVQQKHSFANAQTLVGQGPGFKSFFRLKPVNDPWFWPLWGYEYDDDLYIYVTELHQSGTGNFGFASTGREFLAKMRKSDLAITDYLPLPDFQGDQFGSGFVKQSDGFMYTYGFKGTTNGSEMRVARFKAESPAENWQFWTGHNWSDSVTNCAAVLRTPVVSLSVYKVRNKFLLVGSALSVSCDMGRDIFVATSDSPVGPFSAPKKIYTIDATVDGHYPFFYMPVAHPEFINHKSELLLTYSINGYDPCVKTCVDGHMNPDHYRPRAIRVPLKLIDPEFR